MTPSMVSRSRHKGIHYLLHQFLAIINTNYVKSFIPVFAVMLYSREYDLLRRADCDKDMGALSLRNRREKKQALPYNSNAPMLVATRALCDAACIRRILVCLVLVVESTVLDYLYCCLQLHLIILLSVISCELRLCGWEPARSRCPDSFWSRDCFLQNSPVPHGSNTALAVFPSNSCDACILDVCLSRHIEP